MIPWKWLIIDGWKSHGIPAYLVGTLIDDLNARAEAEGQPVAFEAKDTIHCAIDQPGMCYTDRPWMTFQIDGLAVEMPCEDVFDFVQQLKKLPKRTWKHGESQFVGADYYKVHGFHRCLVLTPDLHAQLLAELEAGLQEAEARATAFLADKKPAWQVLQEANAIAAGKDKDAYKNVDFGGHKNDRIHDKLKKPKGQA